MADLTHKERLRRLICRQPVDRLPTQVSYTRSMGAILARHFGVSPEELPAHLDNHLVRVDLTHQERVNPDLGVRYDWWGAGHDTGEEGYYIKVHPLALLRFNEIQDPAVKEEIAALTYSYPNKADFFVEKMAEGVGMIAAAFYPKPVIVRLSDFKTNE